MAYETRQYQTIYASIKAYIIANQSRITDFNQGSVIASEVEAFAREMALAYSEVRAGFSEVIRKMAFTVFGLTKQEPQYAIGSVTFSRSTTTESIMIPLGTQVSTVGGVIFETTAAVTLGVGVASASVGVKAVDYGKSGNVPAGSVTVFVSGIAGVDAVTNQGNIGGGVDEESDSEYLIRFRVFLLGLAKSNKYGIMIGALMDSRIRSAAVVEHFPPKIGLYNFTLYLDDGQGTVSPETIAAVKSIIDGNGTADNPGYRAAGINVDYLSPSIVYVNVVGSVVVSYAVELSEAKSLIESKIESFINGHLIGSDVIRAQLQKAILAFPWVLDLSITTPNANIAITQGQIARIGTITMTYDQTEGD